jgi:uncharacterized protein YjiS (DUF1127 family)
MSDIFVPAVSPALRLMVFLSHCLDRMTVRLRVQVELATMDDRTLADLGLSRADISRVARAHAASM